MPLEQTLDAIPTPTMVVSRELTIEFCNKAADPELRNSGWLHCEDRRLARLGHMDRPMLAALLASRVPAQLPIARALSASSSQAILRIAWIAPESDVLARWPRAHAILTVERPGAGDEERDVLQAAVRRFHLTATEERVLTLLMKAHSPHEAAASLGVCISTVRTHIRSLFAKTGVRRQAELMRLVFKRATG
jgi:DNA-binding CsgD family transcriptional regulator